ncbi:uncharacterized protein K452DRAFT_311314 [Aplosporella prunicola CBS 121167]|uniref:Uncharacterized protein n=1 Tax=Aplosporella prunicola CBS 121167 TaxID=1176127 RepID=A0A6A6B7U4_9PEZI|nr:uncharacterized protein K452DRAFT_311314 [Aplosporella prunicola CBS 121167]KAF2138861.1 hypothetical protein K452DRAFT_311314 [Aplosporella prunicola CBS 121167]
MVLYYALLLLLLLLLLCCFVLCACLFVCLSAGLRVWAAVYVWCLLLVGWLGEGLSELEWRVWLLQWWIAFWAERVCYAVEKGRYKHDKDTIAGNNSTIKRGER